MAFFRKKPDLISERARTLNAEISALEAQIRQYETKLQDSTEIRAASSSRNTAALNRASSQSLRVDRELHLESVDQRPFTAASQGREAAVHLNEFGVRKYDLPAFISKIRGFFKAPTTSNPKLVSYLAAGGIQGLRPLRYEKRVARNRFIVLVTILFCLLLGIWVALRPH